MKKEKYTSADILSALTMEARRLDISYAELSNQLKNSPVREQEIVNAYMKQKKEKSKQNVKHCKGCAYSSGSICNFYETGRVRRRGAEGNCLEYTTEKPKLRRDAPTKFQRLLDGDWHDKTVPEIAEVLETKECHVNQMVYDAKKKLGINVVFKRRPNRIVSDICVRQDIRPTARETEYLELYKAGKSLTEIAAEKGVAICTVSKALSKFKANKD